MRRGDKVVEEGKEEECGMKERLGVGMHCEDREWRNEEERKEG